MILHWRTGLDQTNDFQKFCGSGLDRIQFYRIRTGLGLKNFAHLWSIAVKNIVSLATDDFQKFCGQDWIGFNFIGSGLVWD